MAGIGFPEMVVIAVIALVIFGPKKLPQLGESMGRAISNFKKSMNDGLKETVAEKTADVKVIEKKTEA
jgi:sec-independent protein translocase protein TatA